MDTRDGNDHDVGFTLIELLSVMVIIGVLASIAIALFINQKAKADAAASVEDLSSVGEHVTIYYVHHPADAPLPSVVVAGGSPLAVDGEALGEASDGTELGTVSGTGAEDWCVSITSTKVLPTTFWEYSAGGGLRGPLSADPC